QGGIQTFDAHNLNVIIVGKLRGDLFAAAELEYEHGGEEIALEFAYLAFTRWRYVNIVAGKFIVPFGNFNVSHPAWISKVPGRPFGFDNVFPATYEDIGLMLRGGLPAGYLSRVTYDVWVVNGLAGADGADVRDLRDNLVDVDRNKFVGGRLGFVARMGLDVGASINTGRYDSANDLTITLFGADARYERSGFEIRGEFVQANQDATAGQIKKRGGYGQLAYLARRTIEPTVRVSQKNFPGEVREYSAGFSVYPSDLAALRLFYRVNEELGRAETRNNLFTAQFTVAF
ncbi:MAG TPA: hypothetical protein VFU41_15295, partial [Gemmatimonadales bacterium]|nr:hypothetical protein [Gemmatimonadales bacterium]